MKKNSKLISKKCSSLKPLAAAAFALVLSSSPAFAIPQSGKAVSLKTLENDLATFSKKKGVNFQALIDQWEDRYGPAATDPLLRFAANAKARDRDRFVALMAATKLGGQKAAPSITPLLKDKNWMVRSGALRSMEILDYRPASKEVLAMLKDPALVIRAQAAATVEAMKPEGATEALLAAVYDGRNYRPGNYKKGRADWVPQRALAALRRLKPAGISHRLLPLLNESKDRKLRAHALFTIETLEGKSLKKGAPFKTRALAWNQALKK